MKYVDVLIAAAIFTIIILIIVPLSTVLLDFFLIINITLAIMVLLMTLFTKEALEFSVFPPLLLVLTLFRLSLNISSTRLILGNNGDAGAVIRTFGSFVIGSNLAVGVVVFLIIIIVQFIVITKGAERVAEVAARFTLDAMPGKQMSIDADLNAGQINEQQAKERRMKIQHEADFYGSMDGASKFVKGDAIVGLLIVVINMVGGIIIGMVSSGMDMDDVISRYTLASVGDGLVSQIPALMISTATGILVTRAASEHNLGRDISSQMTAQPALLIIAAGTVLALGFIPGLPTFQIIMLALFIGGLGMVLRQQQQRKIAEKQARDVATMQHQSDETAEKQDSVANLLHIDPIELELGYGLIPLADPAQNGDLSERISVIRRQFASDYGLIIPGIRLHDNVLLQTNTYCLKIRGEEVAKGEVMPEGLMAMHPENHSDYPFDGIETVEPSFGLPALWISSRDQEKAELYGYTLIDPASVIATHLTEVLKRYGHELIDRQQVKDLVAFLSESQPVLVEETIPKLFSMGELQKVLTGLLRETVPIRDIGTIVETMGEHAQSTRKPEQLVEFVRQRLRRSISRRFIDAEHARVITVDPQLEQTILEKLRQTEQGSFVALAPDQIQKLLISLKTALEDSLSLGVQPIVLTSPAVRPHFKKLSEQLAPDLTVLSYNEVESHIEIQAERMVSIQA